MDDDNQPKDKKWSVLENDCHQDAPHVKIAANLFGFLASRGIKVHYFVLKVTFYFGQYLTRRITFAAGTIIVNCRSDQFQIHRTARQRSLSVLTFGS